MPVPVPSSSPAAVMPVGIAKEPCRLPFTAQPGGRGRKRDHLFLQPALQLLLPPSHIRTGTQLVQEPEEFF